MPRLLLLLIILLISCIKSNEDINSELEKLISENKITELKKLLNKHNVRIGQERIISLIYQEKFELVGTLINHITDINHQDSDGVSPIMVVLLKGELKLAYEFLKMGANPFLKNNNNRNAFDYLLYNNKPIIIKDFLYHYFIYYENNIKINKKLLHNVYSDKLIQTELEELKKTHSEYRNIFLCFSILNNNFELFSELLEIDQRNKNDTIYSNLTLFNLSTALNKKNFINLMFQNSFDFLKSDPLGFTPIEYAFTFDHKELQELYLRAYIKDAAKSKLEKETIKYIDLYKKEIKLLKFNEKLASYLLLYFNIRKDNEIIRRLIVNEKVLSIVDLSKRYPLSTAAAYGNHEVLEYFINSGADPNKLNPNTYKTSPLMEAAMSGNVKSGEVLINHGALINFPDKNNDPALNYAVFYNHIDFVKMLIKKNADITMKGQASYTPLMTARVNGYKEIETLLLKAGAKD